MNHSSPITTTASSLPARKITRHELAAHCRLSVRKIDELTRSGMLGHYKIGGAVRYDLAEVEATLRERFHVQPTAPAHPAQGRAGCPQPAAPKPLIHVEEASPHDTPQAPVSPATTTPQPAA